MPDETTTQNPYALEQQDWQTLMRKGVIGKITLRRWRAITKLTATDLGLVVEDEEARTAIAHLVQFGNKRLLPLATIRALENIDRSARHNLERCSYKTAFGRFIPYTAFADWRARNAEWEQQYYQIRDAILADYGGIVQRILLDYRHLAREAWTIIALRSPHTLSDQEPDAWIRSFVERIRTHIPTPAQIKDSFAYETQLMRIDFPDLVQGQETGITADAVLSQMAERELEERALSERERQLADMNAAIVAQARRQKEQVVTAFLTDIATQIRTLVYEATTDVLGAIQQAITLPSQQARRLNRLIGDLQRLNFTDDEEITRIVAAMQAMTETERKEQPDMEAIRTQLRQIAIVTRAELLDLGEAPRMERTEEDGAILGEATIDEIRQARLEFFAAPLLETSSEIRQERLAEKLRSQNA